MNRVKEIFLGLALLFAFGLSVSAQPVITGLNDTEIPRSGRVAILGTGFGAGGDVLIAGSPAWVTTWTDTRVVAYVPEQTPLGVVPLEVVVQSQTSNVVSLTVTPRLSDGRVKWTFEADGTNLWWRPALAPDGTIYVHSNNNTDGIVYALSPDGALLWVQTVHWYPYTPPTAGPDGEVYVGSVALIYRISSQGQIDWEFSAAGGPGIHTAAKIGPDGFLYGAFDAGIGAFSLEPSTGDLQWSNTGDPFMSDVGNLGNEPVFGPSGPGQPPDRLYVSQDGTADLYAFTLDGDQIFSRGLGSESTEPVIGADGTIYSVAYLANWIVALDPNDGSTIWEHHPPGGSWEIEGLEIGPDDTLYYNIGGTMQAFDPEAQSPVWTNATGVLLDRFTLTPDGSILVTSGVPTFGEPGFVKGYSAETGQELWNVDLPGDPYPGFRVLGTHHPRITADGATAYVSTFTVADGSPPTDPRSYLYAIETAEFIGDSFIRGDANGDGAYDLSDVITTLNHLFQGIPVGCHGAMDSNDDEVVDVSDGIYSLAALFSSGPLPPSPHPNCGPDPTPGGLSCDTPPASCP